MWLELAVFFTALAVLAYLDVRKPSNYPPGPPRWPLLGNLVQVARLVKRTGFHHLAWARLAERYGAVVALRMGRSQTVVLVAGRRAVTQVLASEHFDGRPDGYLFRLRTMGRRHGVIFTDGDLWRTQRRFSLKQLRELGFGRRSMEAMIASEALAAARRLREEGAERGEAGVPMKHAFVVPVLNSLWAITAGTTYSEKDPRLQRFISMSNEIFRNSDSSGGALNYLPFLRFLAPTLSGYKQFFTNQYNLWCFFTDIVRDHVATLSKDYNRDLIDVFLQEMDKQKDTKETTFTEAQIVAVCKDLFTAGSETTSNTLSFAIMFAVLHPEAQGRVHSELDEVVGRDRPPSLQDKSKLTYVSAFLMETQRLSNVAPMTLPHRALVDAEIDGYFVPKDSTVIMSLWSCHMDPDHWEDPENFRPERFIDSQGRLISDPWLMPFGYGRRRCLGETLAKNSLFLFFAVLLQSLSFRLPEGAERPSYSGQNGLTLSTQPFSAVVTQRP
ncbi:methyl farnesoate epoxidase-like [Bacillus rossius redtenbacheri]|uniref:methyl farnesoate epoxidase-like n=1 Tax=Bacillus rossius redtenbacheri TaxID=93214 RepID=UPI002FDD5123